MNYPTLEYRALKRSLTEAKHILSRVPETQNNSSLDHLKVQSFVLLAHAAFEVYLESLATKVMDISVDAYNRDLGINVCIIGLITFETVAQFDKDTPRREISAKVVKNTKSYVNIAKAHHAEVVRGNHGIRIKDQKSLLLPIGIDPEETDSVVAASLDAFGTSRGGIAHAFKIQTNHTRSSVLSAVNAILSGLKSYDEEACKIVNAAAP